MNTSKRQISFQSILTGAVVGVAMALLVTGMFGLGAVIGGSYMAFYAIVREFELDSKSEPHHLPGLGRIPRRTKTMSDWFRFALLAFVGGAILSPAFVGVSGMVVSAVACHIHEPCWHMSSGGEMQVPLGTRLFIGGLHGAITAWLAQKLNQGSVQRIGRII